MLSPSHSAEEAGLEEAPWGRKRSWSFETGDAGAKEVCGQHDHRHTEAGGRGLLCGQEECSKAQRTVPEKSVAVFKILCKESPQSSFF